MLCLCCTHVCVESVVHGGPHLLLNCLSGCDDAQCVYASEHCTNITPFLKPKYASHNDICTVVLTSESCQKDMLKCSENASMTWVVVGCMRALVVLHCVIA